jgi:hypothetical protein
MMAEVPLLDDRPSPVAVSTPNLALGDFAFQQRDGVLVVRELNDPGSLDADMVEVENDRVALPAIHAGSGFEVIGDKKQVATTARPGISFGPPVWVYPPRTGPQSRPSPVTAGAHELAVRDLCNHTLQAIGLAHELADLHCLRADVVELENRGILKAAIGACTRLEDLYDVRPGDRSALVPRPAALQSVKISALPHVIAAAVLTRTLTAMELVYRQGSITVIAVSRFRWLHLLRDFRSRRGRHDDVRGPGACRRQGHSELATDVTERVSLGAKLPSNSVLPDLGRRHTNTCSSKARMDPGTYNRTAALVPRGRGLAVQDTGLSRRGSRVRIPSPLLSRPGCRCLGI